jgi:hypothetical protein
MGTMATEYRITLDGRDGEDRRGIFAVVTAPPAGMRNASWMATAQVAVSDDTAPGACAALASRLRELADAVEDGGIQ